MSQDLITTVIAEVLGVEPTDVKPETKLVEDLDADSLDCVEIVMGIEDELGIGIPDADAEKLETVQNIFDYVAGVKDGGK